METYWAQLVLVRGEKFELSLSWPVIGHISPYPYLSLVKANNFVFPQWTSRRSDQCLPMAGNVSHGHSMSIEHAHSSCDTFILSPVPTLWLTKKDSLNSSALILNVSPLLLLTPIMENLQLGIENLISRQTHHKDFASFYLNHYLELIHKVWVNCATQKLSNGNSQNQSR